MTSLNMQGPYKLTEVEVDCVVTRESPGNYSLGRVDDSTFIVKYEGRSDSDVNGRLKTWVGNYPSFKLSYASSPKAAIEEECNNYLDFGGKGKLNNKSHPDRLNGTDWKCPRGDYP